MKRGIILLTSLLLLGAATAQAGMADARNTNFGHGTESAYTAALNVLAADGWRDIRDLRREGDFVRATVRGFDGRRRSVLVDPRTDVVLPELETVSED
ncbi:hypothetical protein [Roseomonas chloroacetimidivorans]|uniref:hypothetical protein n=1 Tax=Roseomonas chloroacetimidivorans TaxID=1766656 RepID=UPI003C77D398